MCIDSPWKICRFEYWRGSIVQQDWFATTFKVLNLCFLLTLSSSYVKFGFKLGSYWISKDPEHVFSLYWLMSILNLKVERVFLLLNGYSVITEAFKGTTACDFAGRPNIRTSRYNCNYCNNKMNSNSFWVVSESQR